METSSRLAQDSRERLLFPEEGPSGWILSEPIPAWAGFGTGENVEYWKTMEADLALALKALDTAACAAEEVSVRIANMRDRARQVIDMLEYPEKYEDPYHVDYGNAATDAGC